MEHISKSIDLIMENLDVPICKHKDESDYALRTLTDTVIYDNIGCFACPGYNIKCSEYLI